MTATASELADLRLEREYRERHRALADVARLRYRLPAEDCEEVADDALIAWHRELSTGGTVEFDNAFCFTVLRRRALSRVRHQRLLEMVDLAAVENIGTDPHLDAAAVGREQARELCATARRVLSEEELRLLGMRLIGYQRREIARYAGLSGREVATVLQRVRRKLRAAIENQRQRG